MTAEPEGFTPQSVTPSVGAALASDLGLLARLHDRELDEEILDIIKEIPVREWFSLNLEGPEAEEAFRLIEKSLAEIPDLSEPGAVDELAAEYAAIYLTHAYRSAPTESVWRDEEGLERQAAMFRVRSWYEHYGIRVPNWRVRSDDHIVHEIEFLAFLCEVGKDADNMAQPARFLREHPLVWIPEFCRRVVQRCQLPLYAGIALLTLAYLQRLAEFLGKLTGEDMTAAPMELPHGATGVNGSKMPTCGDPPARYVPGIEPSW